MRGRWVRVDADLVAKLRRKQNRRLSGIEALAAALTGELDMDGERIEFETAGALQDLADRLKQHDGRAELPQPTGLDATLREYQRRGVAWMSFRYGMGEERSSRRNSW